MQKQNLMRPGRIQNIPILLLTLVAASLLGACSTTKILSEDQTRLKSNVITIVNRKEYPDYQDSHLDNYIRQKANTSFIKTQKGGWNPFIYVANWTNGKGGGWDRFVTKLGQAPVVFDPELMEDSRDNMATLLKNMGF